MRCIKYSIVNLYYAFIITTVVIASKVNFRNQGDFPQCEDISEVIVSHWLQRLGSHETINA